MASPVLSLRDRSGLELGLVRNRRSSGDGTAGRRARNRVSSTNSTRMAVVGSGWQLFRGLLCHLARPGGRPGTGAFLGWAELRSLERKTFICRALCQLIPSGTRQPPALDRGCRIAPFHRENHASKARPSTGEGSNYLFRDVKSICQRLFIPITSPRRGRGRPQAGWGGPQRRATNNEEVPIAPNGAVRVNFASAHAVRTPSALTPYVLQWCVFKISYMHLRRQGHEIRSEHTVQNGFKVFRKFSK
jgi:hypothetical protein